MTPNQYFLRAQSAQPPAAIVGVLVALIAVLVALR